MKRIGITKRVRLGILSINRGLTAFRILAFAYRGCIVDPAVYARPGDSFSEDANGNIITVPENVPPSETDPFGLKKLRWFNGENLVPDPEDPSSWTMTGGTTYDSLTEQFTIPNAGQLRFVSRTTQDYRNILTSAGFQFELFSGNGRFQIFDGVGGTTVDFDSNFAEVEHTSDPAATFFFVSIINGLGPNLVISPERPQVNEGPLIPYIPVGNTPVQPATLTLRAQDETAQPFTGLPDGIELGTPTWPNLGTDITLVDGVLFWSGIFGGSQLAFDNKGILNNNTYEVSYKIQGRTVGTMQPYALSEGGGVIRNSDGVYTELIVSDGTANGNFFFFGRDGFDGSVSDYSIQKLLPALSEKPFSDFTEDVPPEPFDFGLDQLLNGRATGANPYNDFDFTTFATLGAVTATVNTFTSTGSGGVIGENSLIIGETYQVLINGSTTANGFSITTRGATSGTQIYVVTGSGNFQSGAITFMADRTGLYFRNEGSGTATVPSIEVRQISGAVGRIPFDQITFLQVLNPELLTNGTNPTDTGWTKEAGWTISGGAFRYSGTTDSDIFAPIGVSEQFLKFVLIITESTIDGTLMIADGTEATQTTLPKTVGTHIVRLKNDGATDTNFGLRVEGNTTGTFAASSMSVKEFTSLFQNNDRDTMAWIDPDDGLINVIDTDGNIALSPSAVIADTETTFDIKLLGTTFSVTKDDLIGVAVQFSGSLLPTGEQLYFDNSGQNSNAMTVRNAYFDSNLNLEDSSYLADDLPADLG